MKGFGHVVPAVVLNARAEAAALLREAGAQAQTIRDDADAVRVEARREGLEEGRAEGLAAVAVALAGARAEAQRTLEIATPNAIALALRMTEKIVGHAVELAPEVMTHIAAAALEACRPRGGTVRLRLHPDDLAGVSARLDLLAARVPTAAGFDLVADESVGRYGCVIETPHGRVDARLEAQLAALERALEGSGRG